MEMVGESLAKKKLETEDPILESMFIDYVSVGRGNVKIVAEAITTTQMRVCIYSEKGKIVSDGKLTWSAPVVKPTLMKKSTSKK